MFAFLGVLLAWPTQSRADTRSCQGPDVCCPSKIEDSLTGHVDVALGVVLLGLYNVNEKAGTWDADFYLNEVWPVTPGFTPQTEIVNEVVRQSEQFDNTELKDGRCIRFRRVRSTLHSAFNLRTFPFDHQRLMLQLSDAQFTARELRYTDRPAAAELDESTREWLSSWMLEGDLTYARAERIYKGEVGSPKYDYATFSVPVRRHISFHLTKFFLPLLIIIAVAFAALWMDPEDLNSRAGVGVTCLLAAIALQFAEAGNLPEVAYLTIADRGFAICYIALALAMLESIRSNMLVRKGLRDRALRYDRRARLGFPLALAVMLLLSVVRAYTQTGN